MWPVPLHGGGTCMAVTWWHVHWEVDALSAIAIGHDEKQLDTTVLLYVGSDTGS